VNYLAKVLAITQQLRPCRPAEKGGSGTA